MNTTVIMETEYGTDYNIEYGESKKEYHIEVYHINEQYELVLTKKDLNEMLKTLEDQQCQTQK